MTFLTLLAAAAASDPISAISSQIEDGQGPPVIVACAPLRLPMERLQSSPLVEMFSSQAPPEAQSMLQLLNPDAAAALGLNPDGALIILGEEGRGDNRAGSLWVPFSGSAEQVQEMLEGMVPEVQAHDSGWLLPSARGATDVMLADGHLQLSQGAALSSVAVSESLLSDASADPGCAALITNTEEKSLTSVLLQVPMNNPDELLRFRVPSVTPITPPPTSTTIPHNISTTSEPWGVIVMGMEPLPMLEQLAALGEISAEEDADQSGLASLSDEDLKELAGQLRIMPGATIALFGELRKPTWAATVPVASPSGKPLAVWKLRRGLKRSDNEVSWTNRRTFSFVHEETTFYGALDKGQVRLASGTLLLEETGTEEGTPWVSPEQAARLEAFPVSMQMTPPMALPGMPSLSVHIGTRMTTDYTEMVISIPNAGSELLSALVNFGMAMRAQQEMMEQMEMQMEGMEP